MLDTNDGVLLSGQCVLDNNRRAETDFIIVVQEHVKFSAFILFKLTADMQEGSKSQAQKVYIYRNAKFFQKERPHHRHRHLFKMTCTQLSKRDLKAEVGNFNKTF